MPKIEDVLALNDKQLADLSYEQARELLDVVVAALEDAEQPLAQLMQLWEVGEKIAKVCDGHLAAAAMRLEDEKA